MLDKYLYLNIEKYKANYTQSKTSGQLFFDISVSASSRKELKTESEEAVHICTEICNNFNKKLSIDGDNNKNKKLKVDKIDATK